MSDIGQLGVASRLRRIDGMKNEIENREAAIVRFKGQLKAAKGKEKAKLHRLIKKYEARIKALREAIEEKGERKEQRGRWWERAQTRASVFSGELGDALGAMVPESAFGKIATGGVVLALTGWLLSKSAKTRR